MIRQGLGQQVASSRAGVDYKESVVVAAKGPLAGTRVGNTITANAPGALAKIDIDGSWGGVTVITTATRILLTAQADPSDNGIFYPSDLGSFVTPWKLTRTHDADSDFEVTSGMVVHVTEGTFATLSFVLTTIDPINLNADALTFVLSGSAISPLLWQKNYDLGPAGYPAGVSVLVTYVPVAPRTQIVLRAWKLPGKISTVTPGIRITFSDASVLLYENVIAGTLYDRACDEKFGKDGLTINQVEFIATNSGILVPVDLDEFEADGEML